MGLIAPAPVALTYGPGVGGTIAPAPLLVVADPKTSGRVTLVAGVKVVNTTAIAVGSNVITQIQSLGTVTAPKAVGVTARVVGTSFTITSADVTDTSVISWEIH